MESIGQYLLTVCTAAILCSIVNGLVGKKGGQKNIIQMVSSLFLTITVLSPLTKIQIGDLSLWMQTVSADADSAVSYGQNLAKDSMITNIKSGCEAYILDKAGQLQINITVQVEVEDAEIPKPCRVTLQGNASPYARSRLQTIIQEDLGIQKEQQIWI